MTESRSSLDSESNFSLIEHGSSRVGRAGPLGPGHGITSNGRVNSYCACSFRASCGWSADFEGKPSLR